MKFHTHNNAFIDIGGTHLQGYVQAPYSTLVQCLGEPAEGFDKTDAEWTIQTEDGTIITVYNWKNGYNYCGEDGLDVELMTQWNVGGHSREAVHKLNDILSAFSLLASVREAA